MEAIRLTGGAADGLVLRRSYVSRYIEVPLEGLGFVRYEMTEEVDEHGRPVYRHAPKETDNRSRSDKR